jgi:hypothetical protein
MSDNDVVGLHRAVVALVTDDEARQSWLCDPEAFTGSKRSPCRTWRRRTDSTICTSFITSSKIARPQSGPPRRAATTTICMATAMITHTSMAIPTEHRYERA